MSLGSLRRRAAIALTVVLALAAPVVGSGQAFADKIGDKREEAARVADQVDDLREKAEVIAEQFNDAQLELTSLNEDAKTAAAKSSKSTTVLNARRKEMASYAVAAYVRGGDTSTATLILTSEDGNELGQRRGYASVAAGENADAVEQMRDAISTAEADKSRLKVAKAAVEKLKVEVDVKRQEANESVAAASSVLNKVNGELRTLVAQEQARRAAAAAKAAREAAKRLAAEQAAYAAAHPRPRPAARPATQASNSAASADRTNDSNDAPVADDSNDAPVVDVAPVGEGADAAIAAARSVLGVPYKWAGASPSTGFDCSGLVLWAWQHGGKSLPHSSRAMYSSSRRISLAAMEPGDLVFYGSPIHHVALYLGGGQIIHSPHTGSVVKIDSVSYWKDVKGAGRI